MPKSSAKTAGGNMVSLALATVEDKDYPRVVSFPAGVPERSEDMRLLVCQKNSSHRSGSGSGKRKKTQILSGLPGLSFKGTDYGEDNTIKNNQCRVRSEYGDNNG